MIVAGNGRVDRPRERLAYAGPHVLADSELLALILRTGCRDRDAWSMARGILELAGGLEGLVDLSLRELEAFEGLGPAKAGGVVAAVEIARRIATRPLERGRPIRGPKDVHRHFSASLRGMRRETFQVLLLDGRHHLISIQEVSVGTLTASLVHPREVFREAIRSAAAAMLLVHNHPSGDPSPSAEDRSVTERLRAAGELVGIRVVDHVIVAETGYFSFREATDAFAEDALAPRESAST